MISEEQLEKQRREVEALRLQADREEVLARIAAARTAKRAAELEAVRLGVRRECDQGCGRELTKMVQGPTCRHCRNSAWMRRSRLEVVR